MRVFKLLILCFLVLNCDTKKEVSTLKIMTYNIRLNVDSDGENAWPNRRDFLSSQVLFLSPEVLGVQEALPSQIKDLNTLLPDYNFVGIGRDGGNKGEYSAIYYDTKKVNIEQENTFWLSKTTEKVSKGWDAALPRICTYALFSKKDSNDKFWVFNTHFDHVGKNARKESMKLIIEKIKNLNTKDYPVILMGDLNVEPSSDVISLAKKQLIDTKEVANIQFGPIGTFNGFNYNEPVNRRIDYIFVSKSPIIEVQKYGVLSSNIDFKFPSDHFPIYVELKLR